MKRLLSLLTASVALLFMACSDDQQSPKPQPEDPTPEQPTPDVPAPEQGAQVGDYFYADGSYSTLLDEGKECIGLIFWLGDPTTTDPTLKREHPECTHGLVMALHHNSSAWQSLFWKSEARVSAWLEQQPELAYELPLLSNQEASIGKICGYNNTRAIELYNAAPENSTWPVEAVQFAHEYSQRVEAPASTSGWYIPSPKELSLMCSGEYEGNIYDLSTKMIERRTLLNERLKALSGINSLPGNLHWSSAEFDDQGVDAVVGWQVAISVLFSEGDVSVSFKDYGSAFVRPVLAF